MLNKPYTFLVVGRSGCGKGTQIEKMIHKYNIDVVLSSGHIFRKIIEAGSQAGRKIQEIFDRGDLPPDWLFLAEVQHEIVLSLKTGSESLILDGMLRRPEEAVAISILFDWYGRRLTPILIDISEEESMKRLLARGRSDDNEENIRRRLDWFKTSYMKSIDFLREKYGLIKIDGMGTPEDVFNRIVTALESKI